VVCFRCSLPGHFALACPRRPGSGRRGGPWGGGPAACCGWGPRSRSTGQGGGGLAPRAAAVQRRAEAARRPHPGLHSPGPAGGRGDEFRAPAQPGGTPDGGGADELLGPPERSCPLSREVTHGGGAVLLQGPGELGG